MKHFSMMGPKETPKKVPEARKQNEAFDIWLERGLHELFDDVKDEPVPEDLLKLIRDHQNGSNKK